MIERLIGRPLHYAWLMLIVTFVTLITTAGFRATPVSADALCLVAAGLSLRIGKHERRLPRLLSEPLPA